MFLENEQGVIVVYAGADDIGDGLLKVLSKAGTNLIYAGADVEGHGNLTVMSYGHRFDLRGGQHRRPWLVGESYVENGTDVDLRRSC